MADNPLHDHPRSKVESDDDPRDFTDRFNTKLSAEDEKKYQKWAADNGRENDTRDYDMRGAWKEGAGQSENGHFPDTHKKPNHPTFSDESKYHGGDHEGGKWGKSGDRATFTPGKSNRKHWKPEELRKYFDEVEPGIELLPGD